MCQYFSLSTGGVNPKCQNFGFPIDAPATSKIQDEFEASLRREPPIPTESWFTESFCSRR